MKKDTLDNIIDLDNFLTESATHDTVTDSAIQSSVNIDYADIVTEWSYRCRRGYPEWNDAEDMVVLQTILEERNIPLPFEHILNSNISDNAVLNIHNMVTETTKTINEIELSDIKIKKAFIDKIIAAKKQKAFATFLRNLPGGETEIALPAFLNGLSSKEQDEFVKKLYTAKTVEDINKADYTSGVGAKLFALEPKGIGKAELFLAMMIINSKVSGQGESYDLMINNAKKYEIKDYRKDNSSGIRLGTKGKVTQFGFWNEITKTLDVLNDLIVEGGIKFIDDKELVTLIKDIAKRGEEFTRRGEFSKTDLKQYNQLYVKLNELSQSDATGYTYVTFRGPNIAPISFTIDEIPAKLKKSVTLNLLDRGISDSFIVNLRRLKYVRNPKDLDADIQSSVDQIVGTLPFVVFRPAGPIITIDFVFHSISQSTVYIIEKELAQKKK